jgi:hypothetical protein
MEIRANHRRVGVPVAGDRDQRIDSAFRAGSPARGNRHKPGNKHGKNDG